MRWPSIGSLQLAAINLTAPPQGRVVGWLNNDPFTDLRGRSIAYLRNGSIYSYQGGKHLGGWSGDHMRRPDGGVVVWLNGAKNLGIIPPIAAIPPIPAISPIPPIPAIPPIAPINTMGWSRLPFGSW